MRSIPVCTLPQRTWWDFDAKNLYMALTRGSKSLTVVSREKIIQPKAVAGPNAGGQG
jgi:hypothetical protein